MSRGISLDVDLARELGLAAAIVFNELQFWSSKGRREDGWIYKSYDEMVERLPLAERTIRTAYRTLEEAGLIETQVMKVDANPTLHYKLCRKETANIAGTIETANIAGTSIYSEKNTKKVVAERDLAVDIADPDLLASFLLFVSHRKSIRKPVTREAQPLVLKKLEKMYPGNLRLQSQVLLQSVENGWQGLFELKDVEAGTPSRGFA